MGALRDDPILEILKKERLPTVLVARETAFDGFSAVGMDNFQGAKIATEHLISLGHKRIAFLGGNEQYEYTRNRLAGYREALKQGGISLGPWVFLGKGDEAAQKLIGEKPKSPSQRNKEPESNPNTGQYSLPITAAIFVNDEHAAAGLPILRAKGVKIPQDLSVIAFDDTDLMSQWTPPISSVAVPRFDIGELAVKSLVEQINRPTIQTIRIILRTVLTVRETSLAPPRGP